MKRSDNEHPSGMFSKGGRLKLSPENRLKCKILYENLISLLYPRTCPSCGKLIKLKKDDWNALMPSSEKFLKKNPFICEACAHKLDHCAEYPRCMKCSKPLEDEREEYCRDCRTKERAFDFGMSALLHDECARELMYDLKYSHLKVNADFAAFEMLKVLLDSSYLLDVDAVIPVPLHRKRLIERGYNQAELIAGELELFLELAGHRPIPVDADYLIRARSSSRLKEMTGQERTDELSGAFAVRGDPGKYRKVLLIDDIFTTGATLNECAKTLRQAGVSVIYFMTVTIGS